MKDRSNELDNYELFFEEIGSKAQQNGNILNEEMPQKDYDQAPSLSATQVSELTHDLKNPMEHPEDKLAQPDEK
jgi:hypothetical protein